MHGGQETAEARDVRRIVGGGAGCVRGQEKWMKFLLNDLRAFGVNADQWATESQDEGEWCKTAEQGAECFVVNWSAAGKARAGLRHAGVCPNVTGGIKERAVQSKSARAGSLAIAD